MKKFLYASLIAATLTGCSAAPKHGQLSYGAYPPVNVPKQAAQEYLKANLMDYNSAIITYGGHPSRGYLHSPIFGTQAVGYHYYVSVNAKNAYGAYTGARDYVFVFRGKELSALVAPKVTSSGLRQRVIFDHTNGGKRTQ
ncbi:lipoprotein [Photobacterium leiognathi]|uniref:lipoprotein n=1 Tax=Photobacterium leiognathi TaxID=553611 RepID=UPI002980CF4A|nr:hypothetical protein [Photobacterium leiognathi]